MCRDEDRAAECLGELERLHAEVDRRATDLGREHADRLQCRRGCASCCVEGITVFAIEAERIRRGNGDLLANCRPHAPGACAFLDEEGACRIYEDRPYVCRTQGLPLRWFEGDGDGRVELRDICPLNEAGGEPIESLPAGSCWTVGPYEGRLARLQERFEGSASRRIRLRDLFATEEPGCGS